MKFSNRYFFVDYFLNNTLKLRFDYRNINWKFDIEIKSLNKLKNDKPLNSRWEWIMEILLRSLACCLVQFSI